jgi:transcriptional repressor NF-X1
MISKECRCKALDFDVKCIDSDKPVMCDSKCNKKMTCRVHKCQIICCPAKRSEDVDNLHACVQLCGKTISCKVHPCSRFCHTGPCPPCDIMMNTSLSCACGAKRVNPPVKCGTEIPICNNTCGKILECGHPCYDKCHFGDCRPCQEIVDKYCACGKV